MIKDTMLVYTYTFGGVLTKILLQKEENIQNFRTILEFTRKSLKHLTWSHTMKERKKKKGKKSWDIFFLASSTKLSMSKDKKFSTLFATIAS